MKRFRLLATALVALLAINYAEAQNHHRRHAAKDYDPSVYLISVHEVDTFMTDCDARQQAAMLNRLSAESAVQDYHTTWRQGHHQVQRPQFVFATRNNRFSFAMGGAIRLRTTYEFDGIVENLDFAPKDIPIPGDFNTEQKVSMDASTSYLFLKAVANTRMGQIVAFIDADFRGGAEGSYTPRIRQAYFQMWGFTAGRDVTTFCDIMATPETIDYDGPNAYSFRYTTLLRYEHSFFNNRLRVGAAAEIPTISATYGDNFAPLNQRMPDFPLYAQFNWGNNLTSHIRASAVLRNMYAYNLKSESNTSLLGWGVQASGHIVIIKPLELFFSGVYGEGISPYIQDLKGLGLDFTPNPAAPTSLQTMPMYGWQAALQVNIIPEKLFVSGGYSTVEVCKKNGYFTENQYRKGEYIFGNIFYHFAPRMTLAVEYLYGSHKIMSGDKNHANRANLLLEYKF